MSDFPRIEAILRSEVGDGYRYLGDPRDLMRKGDKLKKAKPKMFHNTIGPCECVRCRRYA